MAGNPIEMLNSMGAGFFGTLKMMGIPNLQSFLEDFVDMKKRLERLEVKVDKQGKALLSQQKKIARLKKQLAAKETDTDEDDEELDTDD